MKKAYLLLFIFALFAYSCSDDDDDIFPEYSAERMEKRLLECDEMLQSKDWKMIYIPRAGETGGFNVVMKFYNDNGGVKRVNMAVDFADGVTNSTYSYNASQGPVLNFDTYCNLHELGYPSNARPYGLYGETEFVIHEITEDSVVFKSKKIGERVVFYPATEEDWDMVVSARDHMIKLTPGKDEPFFRGLTVRAGAKEDGLLFIYDSTYRSASITWADHQKKTTESFVTAVYGTKDGVAFIPAIVINGIKISKLIYNSDLEVFMPSPEDGLSGTLDYRNEAPFPFYNSCTDLMENSNASATETVDLTGGLISLITLLGDPGYFSASLNINWMSTVTGTGFRQFLLSWRPPVQGMGYEGIWLSYYGTTAGILETGGDMDYYCEAVELDTIGVHGDKAKMKRYEENEKYVTYTTNRDFQSKITGGTVVTSLRELFTNPDGFTVVPSADSWYYFVSLGDSRDWVKLKRY
ncbi:DUF4302 domain-containing protein [Porphyromonadaceae bacterium OttesenSCG-928-L07]|nr:DUF4302 domain-containing protein [Porphyromonadaceae bacterium OttesenSCG-928-L07]MDL2330763.1 DUF4302 domain-containing protein [Odoribacter sp. OttesenSCG-928-A06]